MVTLPQDNADARLRPDRTIEMHTVAAVASHEGGTGQGPDSTGEDADNDSEKGIIQTKTTTVSYSTNPRARQGKVGLGG